MIQSSKPCLRALALFLAAASFAVPLSADAYYWHANCVSDSWYACCEITGDFHNNWWLTPYASCPPSSQYPEEVDDVDILTAGVYLDSLAKVYNFNSDGSFTLLPAPAQLEVHDLATIAGVFYWDGGALAGWGPSTLFRLETVAELRTGSLKFLAGADFDIIAGASLNVTGDGTLLIGLGQMHTLPDATLPGVCNVSTDVIIGHLSSGGGSFLNEGLFKKTGGSGATAVDVPFNNPGRVEVHTGTLHLSGGGVGTGEMDIDAGTVLELAEYTLDAGATFPGAGLVRVPAPVGLLTIETGASVTIPNFEMSGNQTRGGGHLHLNGTFDWQSGALMGTSAGAPTTTIDATGVATLSGSNAKSGAFGTLNNAGLIEFGGTGTLYMGVTEFNTLAGGTFDIQTDADIEGICCAGSGEFTNDGYWVKSAGAGETIVNKHLTNTGLVEVQSGILTFKAADYHQTAGRTRLNGGNLQVLYRLYLNGGVLDGNGTLSAYYLENVAGDVRPGLSAGLLTIAAPMFLSGNYSQGASGKLSIEIGGLTPGVGYDRLAVQDFAFLNGMLDLSLIDGFEPSLGDEFVIVTFGTRVGTFSSVSGATIDAWKSFDVIYNANDVTLRVVGTCGFEPCDADCNGTVNPFDIQPFVDLLGGVGTPCSPCAGDANGNGTVNPFDINDFLDCLM